MKITDDDIRRAEIVFFNGKSSFIDEKGERYQFISCINKSIDVEACPGSGKTTCLLAKLFLLAEKMPFSEGKGICVLTHTNVAINEIKSRLGLRADKLFQYPNFFGTIQSFVDKYLAIPYYALKFKRRPIAIDTQRMANRLKNSYLEYGIKDKVNVVKGFLYANELFDKLTFKKIDGNQCIIVRGINGERIDLKKPKSKTDWTPAEKNEYYDILHKLRSRVFKEDALLSFDDAYFLANEYLKDFSKIKDALSSRFSHVFIDEMQDTYAHQDSIIKSVFDNKVIIQRIGDSNQAILNDNYSESAWCESERMKITGSKRYSQLIANVLKTVAFKGNQALTGNIDVAIPPHIIPYDKGNEEVVLEQFVSIIHDLGIDDNLNEYPIKAVGWVGKEKDGLTIHSYFKPFNNRLNTVKNSFISLKQALSFCNIASPREVSNMIINCCLEILRLSNYKNQTSSGQRFYNKTSFLNLLEKEYPLLLLSLQAHIAYWCKKLFSTNQDEVLSSVRIYFKDSLLPKLNVGLKSAATHFIDSEEIENIIDEQVKLKNVFISKQTKLKHIVVNVGTVHSVKSETHRATLYMETFFHKTCGEYIIDQLIGIPYDGKGKKWKEMCLRIAHVGMSRPTHLLCLALNRNLVEKYRINLERNGWKIL